ncbi:hypothetical protein GGS21DRAFT_546779 [Xylaria nigripes]|nr:hypothetical protein GGS21DRAFT_546779 [Xylaria nigripes]
MVSSKKAYDWYVAMVEAMSMFLYGSDASVFNAARGPQNWLDWFGLDPKADAYLIGLVNTGYTIGTIESPGFFSVGQSLITSDDAGNGSRLLRHYHRYNRPSLCATKQPGRIHWRSCFDRSRQRASKPPYSVGSFIAYWVAYATKLHKKSLGSNGYWRLVVVFQILVPFIIFLLQSWQPESPRWWIQRHDNIKEAKKALSRICETKQDVEDEILAIREAIEYEKEAISGFHTALFKDPSLRKRMYLAFVINVGDLDLERNNQLVNALNATFIIIFTLNALRASDGFGRRCLLIVGAIGMAACILITPIVGMKTPDIIAADGTATKSEPVGIAIVVFLLFLFILFYKPSLSA